MYSCHDHFLPIIFNTNRKFVIETIITSSSFLSRFQRYWSIITKKSAIFIPHLLFSCISPQFSLLISISFLVNHGGLGVTCSPRDPKFACSNLAEVDGFFQDVKFLSTSPLGVILSCGSRVWDFRLVKEPQAWKNRLLRKM